MTRRKKKMAMPRMRHDAVTSAAVAQSSYSQKAAGLTHVGMARSRPAPDAAESAGMRRRR
jgi:hypothetical protein